MEIRKKYYRHTKEILRTCYAKTREGEDATDIAQDHGQSSAVCVAAPAELSLASAPGDSLASLPRL